MRKHLVSIILAVLVCIGALSGCLTQNKQNNSTTPEDTEGPTTPTAVRCTTSTTDNTPTFNWNASTDTSGVAGYYVKIDTNEDTWIGNTLTWTSTSVITAGAHMFYVKAKDASTNGNNGTYGSCSFTINTTTEERPPVAETNGPYVWYVNQSITFDGSKSYDRDGTIVNYTWNLGDGTISYGRIVTHSYNKAGVYTISLTVLDNNSLSDTNTTLATIQLYSDNPGEKSLVAETNGPYVWFVNQSITFDGSKSHDLDGHIVNYIWDLGDGTILYGMLVGHSYSNAGVYTISLTVIDNNSVSDATTTIATIQLYSDNSSTEQGRFLGSWHNEVNGNEHWIFYSNWTQKYTLLVTDNPEEPYTTVLWFNYTVNASMLCQMPFIDYSGVPSYYGYEFSNNDQMLTLFNNGAVMVVLIKD